MRRLGAERASAAVSGRRRRGGGRLLHAALACSLAAAFLALSPGFASAAPTVNCDTQELQPRLDSAPAGSTVLVTGTCQGLFTIDRDLTLKGNPTATLDGG